MDALTPSNEGAQVDERAEKIEARNTHRQAGTSGDESAFVTMCLPDPSCNRLALCLYGVEIGGRKKPRHKQKQITDCVWQRKLQKVRQYRAEKLVYRLGQIVPIIGKQIREERLPFQSIFCNACYADDVEEDREAKPDMLDRCALGSSIHCSP